MPWRMNSSNYQSSEASCVAILCREDLRELCVCSVDPPGCRDIDDALHVRQLPGGSLELGVHIADVTSFLKPETAMDEEASIRWGHQHQWQMIL